MLTRTKIFSLIAALLLAGLVAPPLHADETASGDGTPAPFVTALAADADGNAWLAAEDKGLFRRDPATGEWQSFSPPQVLTEWATTTPTRSPSTGSVGSGSAAFAAA